MTTMVENVVNILFCFNEKTELLFKFEKASLLLGKHLYAVRRSKYKNHFHIIDSLIHLLHLIKQYLQANDYEADAAIHFTTFEYKDAESWTPLIALITWILSLCKGKDTIIIKDHCMIILHGRHNS